jgi:hypothetical protein
MKNLKEATLKLCKFGEDTFERLKEQNRIESEIAERYQIFYALRIQGFKCTSIAELFEVNKSNVFYGIRIHKKRLATIDRMNKLKMNVR